MCENRKLKHIVLYITVGNNEKTVQGQQLTQTISIIWLW